MSKEIKYLQFSPGRDYPVYIEFHGEMTNAMRDIFAETDFVDVAKEVVEEGLKGSKSRMLRFIKASGVAMTKICAVRETDRYGLESFTPGPGYSVYRFRDLAIMVHSLGSDVWELGYTDKFTKFVDEAKIVLHRYLAFAMAPLGVVGFWGAYSENGLVLNRNMELGSEVIYVDVINRSFFIASKECSIDDGLSFLRIDSTSRVLKKSMGREALISFLSTHTTFVDPRGNSSAVGQMLQSLSKLVKGYILQSEEISTIPIDPEVQTMKNSESV